MTNDSYDTLNEDTRIKDQMNKVIIENGEIISGGLDKSVFTKTSKDLSILSIMTLVLRRCKDLLMIFKK